MTTPTLHNLVENHVAQVFDQLKGHFPAFCGCEICRLDVMVYALNRLPPRYVIGLSGSVVTEIDLERDQNRAAIDVTVLDGLRKVTAAPRCGRVKPAT
ncbi:MAG: late competence development ComFB family protein [Gemmatimonadota bacterium]|nr:late competence development ComFB family protein [Gemmatimonadota bacterium]